MHTTSARIRVLGNNARSDPRSTRRASTVRRVAGSGALGIGARSDVNAADSNVHQ